MSMDLTSLSPDVSQDAVGSGDGGCREGVSVMKQQLVMAQVMDGYFDFLVVYEPADRHAVEAFIDRVTSGLEAIGIADVKFATQETFTLSGLGKGETANIDALLQRSSLVCPYMTPEFCDADQQRRLAQELNEFYLNNKEDYPPLCPIRMTQNDKSCRKIFGAEIYWSFYADGKDLIERFKNVFLQCSRSKRLDRERKQREKINRAMESAEESEKEEEMRREQDLQKRKEKMKERLMKAGPLNEPIIIREEKGDKDENSLGKVWQEIDESSLATCPSFHPNSTVSSATKHTAEGLLNKPEQQPPTTPHDRAEAPFPNIDFLLGSSAESTFSAGEETGPPRVTQQSVDLQETANGEKHPDLLPDSADGRQSPQGAESKSVKAGDAGVMGADYQVDDALGSAKDTFSPKLPTAATGLVMEAFLTGKDESGTNKPALASTDQRPGVTDISITRTLDITQGVSQVSLNNEDLAANFSRKVHREDKNPVQSTSNATLAEGTPDAGMDRDKVVATRPSNNNQDQQNPSLLRRISTSVTDLLNHFDG